MNGKILSEAELKFMETVWENEPVKSGNLVKIFAEKEGWKKSTVYTYLKNLSKSGFVINKNSIVISYIEKKDYYSSLARELLAKYFKNDMGNFIAAYKNGEQLTRDELIDFYAKGKNYR